MLERVRTNDGGKEILEGRVLGFMVLAFQVFPRSLLNTM